MSSRLTQEDLRTAARALDRAAFNCERQIELRLETGLSDRLLDSMRTEAEQYRKVEDRIRDVLVQRMVSRQARMRRRAAAGGAS